MNFVPYNDTYDAALVLHDGAAAVTADGAGQVSAAAKIIDTMNGGVFPASGLPDIVQYWAVALIDVTAIDVASTDELYHIYIQMSTSSTFASGIRNVSVITLGNNTLGGQDADWVTGRYVLPFTTNQVGTPMRYLRVFFDVAGTTPSITCTVRLCPMRRH